MMSPCLTFPLQLYYTTELFTSFHKLAQRAFTALRKPEKRWDCSVVSLNEVRIITPLLTYAVQTNYPCDKGVKLKTKT